MVTAGHLNGRPWICDLMRKYMILSHARVAAARQCAPQIAACKGHYLLLSTARTSMYPTSLRIWVAVDAMMHHEEPDDHVQVMALVAVA